MSDVPKAFGLSGLALVPICCLGAALLIAAGLSVAALALIGGITVGVIACAALVLLIVRPARNKTAAARRGQNARTS